MQQSVLFVCTHNSSRSQMAEGLVNHYYRKTHRAFSAGTERTQVNPFAIAAMNELGIDISHHQSQHIDEFMDRQFDLVITVCDSAKETCPYFPHAEQRLHASFPDPSAFVGSDEEKTRYFMKIRDQIRDRLPDLLGIDPDKP